MRILICSFDFFPGMGGTETAGLTLANGLVERGYDVTVVTMIAGKAEEDAKFPFRIVRRPGGIALLSLFRGADLIWHNHVSLRLLWPILLVRRPLILTHHSPLWTDVVSGPRLGTLKRWACMLGRNVFVSAALRAAARLDGPVIYNSYDEDTFKTIAGIARDRDLVFLGRLVSEKGADILIDAVAILAARGQNVSATIIGSGPEEGALKARAAAKQVTNRIVFTGALRGEMLARELNRHRVMVMPSRWEGLPIAAIEAFACGCIVVGANSGGLPETVNGCGMIVPKNDPKAFADALGGLLSNPEKIAGFRRPLAEHLQTFTKAALLDRCEAIIRDACKSGRG